MRERGEVKEADRNKVRWGWETCKRKRGKCLWGVEWTAGKREGERVKMKEDRRIGWEGEKSRNEKECEGRRERREKNKERQRKSNDSIYGNNNTI